MHLLSVYHLRVKTKSAANNPELVASFSNTPMIITKGQRNFEKILEKKHASTPQRPFSAQKKILRKIQTERLSIKIEASRQPEKFQYKFNKKSRYQNKLKCFFRPTLTLPPQLLPIDKIVQKGEKESKVNAFLPMKSHP